MKLALLSDSETNVNIFPEMKERLSVEIADLDTAVEFVPFKADLPKKALELSKDFDLIFVFSLFEEENFEAKLAMEKLTDVELSSGTKILKILRESELEEIADDSEREAARLDLVEKWTNFLLDYIQKPEAFSPEAKKEEKEGSRFASAEF